MSAVLVIVNPESAGGRTTERWNESSSLLRSTLQHEIDVAFTTAPHHATELARDAIGREWVICVGGDGTLNEIVNGLMQHPREARPKISILPSSTGGDFARGMGIPHRMDLAIQKLAQGKPRAVDVGEVAFMRDKKLVTRYFVNVAGVGFDAEAAEEVNRGSKGKLSYFLSVFKVLSRYRNKRVRMTITQNETTQRFETTVSLIAVCNANYFGGGMKVSPRSRVDDGLFDVVMVESMSRIEFALNFPRVYRGTHLTHRKVRALQATETRIDPLDGQRVLLEAEGELLGEAPASFRVLPSALSVVC
jgi:YegS/Rv2252/BmrU family lipid kinase